jgi:hypothetical protein
MPGGASTPTRSMLTPSLRAGQRDYPTDCPFLPKRHRNCMLSSRKNRICDKLMSYRLRILCVFVSVLFQLIGCGRAPMQVSPTAPILKIAISAGGRITVDGSPATMESLRASLKRLAEQKGVVWYYREAGQAEAPPESTEVMKAVIENRLPIRLSSRPDFSDAIGADGNPITKRPSRN